MKAKRKKRGLFVILFLRFLRVMFGEIAAANLIGLIFEVPDGVVSLTIRASFLILSAIFYIIFDKALYERFE